MKDYNMLKFLGKHCDWVVLITIGITLLAPYIFTRKMNIIDFSNTGQIGDTIGGITAPFWGFLSVFLLYLTFKEQHRFNEEQLAFNKMQQASHDYEVLSSLQKHISEIGTTLDFEILENNIPLKCQGLHEIEKLRASSNPTVQITEEQFAILYKQIIALTELCLLFNQIVDSTYITGNLQEYHRRTIKIFEEECLRLLYLYKARNINVILPAHSTLNNFWERFSNNESFIAQLESALKR